MPITVPTSEIRIARTGYYDFLVAVAWDTWTGGGDVSLTRTRAGTAVTVWDSTIDPTWSASDGSVFEGFAKGIPCQVGDLISVAVDHGDGSAQTLASAFLSPYLVDRVADTSVTYSFVETVWIDSKVHNQSNHAVSSGVLSSSHRYRLIVEGIYRVLNSSVGPDAEPIIYLSPSEPQEDGNRDPVFKFSADSAGDSVGYVTNGFRYDKNDGGGSVIPIPITGNTWPNDLQADHIYTYDIGFGGADVLDVWIWDTPLSDNNGQHKVDIYVEV